MFELLAFVTCLYQLVLKASKIQAHPQPSAGEQVGGVESQKPAKPEGLEGVRTEVP